MARGSFAVSLPTDVKYPFRSSPQAQQLCNIRPDRVANNLGRTGRRRRLVGDRLTTTQAQLSELPATGWV